MQFKHLTPEIQFAVIDTINALHPIEAREETLDVLVAKYEYTENGSIVAEESKLTPAQRKEDRFSGRDPEYYPN